MGRDTLEQFTLFDMNEEDYISDDISTHKCKECKKVKPIHSFNTKNILPPQKKEGSFFPTRRQTHEGNVQLFTLDNICKKCGAKGRAGRHARERMYPNPPKNYCCPICNKNEEQLLNNTVLVDKDYNVYKRKRNDLKKVWHRDHDHKTDMFRGWLCNNCNTGLGAMGDNIEGLKKAMRYLEGDSNDS